MPVAVAVSTAAFAAAAAAPLIAVEDEVRMEDDWIDGDEVRGEWLDGADREKVTSEGEVSADSKGEEPTLAFESTQFGGSESER